MKGQWDIDTVVNFDYLLVGQGWLKTAAVVRVISFIAIKVHISYLKRGFGPPILL